MVGKLMWSATAWRGETGLSGGANTRPGMPPHDVRHYMMHPSVVVRHTSPA